MLKLVLFLLLNFGALLIGGLMMGSPANNEWYQNVNKAPWTPPGWVFGFAWTSIMVCFSFFLYQSSLKFSFEQLKIFYLIFSIQWVLNVIWNPIFFKYHYVALGLVIIIALTLIVGWFAYWGFKHIGLKGLFVLPYFIWLLIASSLNAYIYLKN